jgi:hypothetical protein
MRTTAIATTSTASALRLVEDCIPTQLSPRAHEGLPDVAVRSLAWNGMR